MTQHNGHKENLSVCVVSFGRAGTVLLAIMHSSAHKAQRPAPMTFSSDRTWTGSRESDTFLRGKEDGDRKTM
ncbi:hypothetical protein MHYP_G00229880 [Metynnis hypsauchen]